jgi:hypothetical protein
MNKPIIWLYLVHAPGLFLWWGMSLFAGAMSGECLEDDLVQCILRHWFFRPDDSLWLYSSCASGISQ